MHEYLNYLYPIILTIRIKIKNYKYASHSVALISYILDMMICSINNHFFKKKGKQ